MIYKTQAEAQLECDLLNRKHVKLRTGRTWVPAKIKHAGWNSTVPTTHWQPEELLLSPTDHDALAMHARRTCYHGS